MITEAPPNDRNDYFYAVGSPFYLQTTLQAFKDAGADVASMQDIIKLGVYITTAVKCGKTGYAISPATLKNCSELLEKEISLFPDVKVFMLMGDVAIKMMNEIWKRQGKRLFRRGRRIKSGGRSITRGTKGSCRPIRRRAKTSSLKDRKGKWWLRTSGRP